MVAGSHFHENRVENESLDIIEERKSKSQKETMKEKERYQQLATAIVIKKQKVVGAKEAYDWNEQLMMVKHCRRKRQ